MIRTFREPAPRHGKSHPGHVVNIALDVPECAGTEICASSNVGAAVGGLTRVDTLTLALGQDDGVGVEAGSAQGVKGRGRANAKRDGNNGEKSRELVHFLGWVTKDTESSRHG